MFVDILRFSYLTLTSVGRHKIHEWGEKEKQRLICQISKENLSMRKFVIHNDFFTIGLYRFYLYLLKNIRLGQNLGPILSVGWSYHALFVQHLAF